jgi:DegV family protein with EDD domain
MHLEKYLKQNKDVLIISFSSGLSGTFNSYNIAANELNEQYENKVYVVDSLCASLGQGLFLDYIVRYIEQGKSIHDVIAYAEELKLKIRLEFTVDDLFHLKRGGRVGAASAIVGSLMGIKPILHVDDNGKLVAIDKVRGRKASLKHLANLFKENNDLDANDPVFISHGDSIEDAEFLKQLILDIKPNINVYINYIGPVIGSHSGQGTIALFYKGKVR